ncbi:hypothetical protein ROJ8625_01102 [Roseivivax jejudonensis]|uniref:YicC-like family, N-terminal region n=1 Tax=Roseivivax jejudonensis TaxID=1529041 RepID=A0A1X6YPB6_9RHOB|nr:YicC/YloC family endoribonuclease [Roseivivax jejudonensis]SLN26940.1 hypothetical protein ROJ8625_01102 [Roseivivax jejudonensis]
MTQSMTGYASVQGAGAGASWLWEIRSVNSKGLDLRLRLPDWLPGLDPAVRAALKDRVARGSVSVSLRVTADDGASTPRLDPLALDAVLDAVAQVEAAAQERGVDLAPATAAQVVALRGVLEAGAAAPDPDALARAVLADLPGLIDAFVSMRTDEGAAIATILSAQLDEVARLTDAARVAAADRAGEQKTRLAEALARVTDHADGADPDRVAQELALIAVKADVTEEIDRLGAHVAAARGLLGADAPMGRRFDFLMQEFNREANTLCSKAGSTALTEIGLALKVVIDQMREQVQNVE